LRRIANYIGVELELKEYKSSKLTSGEIGIVFNNLILEKSMRAKGQACIPQERIS
jgi:hypothetical protein